ncbi:MAG: hypothetical protein HY023_01865 [Chloroflexi bacterium]|nr:hypothetical protein [Chloroflexota bacterium]
MSLYPENVSLFANGARVLGLAMDGSPEAGRAWPIRVVWQAEKSRVAEQYSFSVRLVEEQGDLFGHVDGLSLYGDLWRQGDTVINRFRLPVSQGYPSDAPLRVEVLMYGGAEVGVVDEAGNEVAEGLRLSPDGAVDQLGWFRYLGAGRYRQLTPHKYIARLASQIDLMGFDAPQTEAHPGGTVPLTLYWKAAETPTIDYRVFAHLRAADASLRGQSDKVSPADVPTSHWPLDQYLVDRHNVSIGPDVVPGRYQLFVGLWEEASGQRAAASDERGTLLGDSVPLPVFVTVTP